MAPIRILVNGAPREFPQPPTVAQILDELALTGKRLAIERNGQIVPATIMSVTMSCDHRSVDGALGAELIGAFKRLIENPVMMVV